MTTTHGKGGVLQSGVNSVAEIKNFEVTETAEVADDSAMGDAARTHQLGLTSWVGRATCHWDKSDTNGQESFTVGASVTVKFNPEGNASGDREGSGTATITEVGVAVDLGDIVERTFEMTGNGALTWANIA